MTLPGRPASLWIDSAPGPAHEPLAGRAETDVCVVGAGIVGVTAALALRRGGRRVALLEGDRVLRGVTGHTTAKLTAGHGVIYRDLERAFGEEGARLYAQANASALEHVRTTAREEGIECHLEDRENYVYTEDPNEVSKLEDEARAARAAGLPASFTTTTPLPYPVEGAVRLGGQAQFHPREYLLGLLARFEAEGGIVHERSRVLDVDDGEPCRIRTADGEVRAGHVLVTTQLPIVDRGFLFARAHPKRHLVVTAQADPIEGMFLSTETPPHSVRSATDADGTPLLVFGGERHRPGESPGPEGYRRLAEWASARFGVRTFRHRWSAQDYVSVDRVPFVGKLGYSRNLLGATGFGAWGMTNGTAAGLLLADLVLGRANPWAGLYDPHRLKPLAAGPKLVTENTRVGAIWVGDRVKPGGSVEDLAPGEAAIVTVKGERAAACRGKDGELSVVSARCTHQGCIVRWNGADGTWDCPCHGSRFDTEGRVLNGPAVHPLKPLPS